MSQLNYQHLYYFWMVVKEGSIVNACEKLHLAQPTISGQLAVFEQAVGEKLLSKQGRKLVLTDTGRTVFHYAEEIFALGRELTHTLKGQASGRGLRLNVGVAYALPKLVAYRLLEPVLRMSQPVQLLCHEEKSDRLLVELALHSIDLVLSDTAALASSHTGIFNHLLGECHVAVFGAPALAEHYANHFPRSLNGAPLLLPSPNTALRRSLDQWFDSESLYPDIKAEIEDSALLKTFAAAGVGLFIAPVVVATEIEQQYKTRLIGHIPSVLERFYAITAQRKLKHPAVVAILENAQNGLFEMLQNSSAEPVVNPG